MKAIWILLIITTTDSIILAAASLLKTNEHISKPHPREARICSVPDDDGFLSPSTRELLSSFRQNVYRKVRRKDVLVRTRRELGSGNILFTQHFSEQLVTPGEDVSLQCAATGDRPPRFIWERDGVVISSNTDQRYTLGQMMSVSGAGVVAQLNISHARVEDGGLYTCVAAEGQHTGAHAARLHVYGPPYIRSLLPVKVQSGEALKLRCPYYGYPISKLEWEHKGRKIMTTMLPQHARYRRSLSTHPHYRNYKGKRRKMYTFESNIHDTRSHNEYEDKERIQRKRQSFILSKLSLLSDEEKYNKTGRQRSKGTNQVGSTNDKRNFRDTERVIKEKQQLVTSEHDLPLDKVSNEENKIRGKRQIYEPTEDGVLHIPRVSKEESGDSYTCIVYSPSGEMARRSFDIQVVEAPELDELRVGTGLKEGQIVQIMCNIISGDPPIYFSWLKDGKKIPANLKINERSSELFSILIIKKVSLEHCGKYTCVATNHVGKANQTVDLYINVAPKWVDEPTNTSLLFGHRGVVYCNANGYPTPQIHWMKKDASLGIWRPVLDLAGGGVLSYPNGSLVLEVVSLGDEGLYACNVDNGVGAALTRNLWITVNKPVHFESLGANLTSKTGQPVTLACAPRGDQPIRIKWTLNGLPIDFTSTRVTVSESASGGGPQSVVRISRAEGRDAGAYECRASNPYGLATYTLHLNVLEPPTPPMDIQVESVSGTSARLSWRDPLPHPARGGLTGVGGASYYTVQYAKNDYSLWEHASAVNVTRVESSVRQSVELVGLQPATEYRARVSAGNQAGLSEHTPPAHFTTQQEAPSSPPVSVQAEPSAAPGELVVWWLPPPPPHHHGPLHGYHVRAVPTIAPDTAAAAGPNETQTKMVKVAARQGKQETILSGLLKNTRYAVSVSAFNAAGAGPFSPPALATTREGAPDLSPAALHCTGVSSTSLRVAWQPIPLHGTSLLGYTVYYTNDDGPWQNISTPHTEVYLPALHKYTNYTVKVAGYSSYGLGPFSHPTLCTTLQDTPGPPAAVKALVSSPSSLLVSWKEPAQPNGEITHYTVYVKPVSSSSGPQSYRVEPQPSTLGQLSLAVTSLSAGPYEVQVRAHTAAGVGALSDRRHVTLNGHKVVAGVSSLGGPVSAGVGSSLLLVCQCVGSPPPRTVWYHNHNIITHHPRYTRNHDDSLLINNIDQSLSGNYTCLAKNLYGSDSVSYEVSVLPTPEPPALTVTPYKNALHLVWAEPRRGGKPQKITYNLTWKEANGSWRDAWSNKGTSIQGALEYTLRGLKCGTKYSLRMTATNSVGTSQPTYVDAMTLGGVPIAPSNSEWLWSNASHIYIQLSGWDEHSCVITGWSVHYRPLGSKAWRKADNRLPQTEQQWSHYSSSILKQSHAYSSSVLNQPNSFVIGDLAPATWYQVRVTAENAAGSSTTIYNYATTTVLGETIGPPSESIDLNMVVIICSSALLLVCCLTAIYILVKKHNHQRLTEYRNSLTAECKSERSNVTANTPQSAAGLPAGLPGDNNRVYSTPIHLPNDNKHELYEISPYAQFAIGFRTFGHVDNQEPPSRMRQPPGAPHTKHRYHHDSETSFQLRSEPEESDCVSRTTTLKSVPNKGCRAPHHR